MTGFEVYGGAIAAIVLTAILTNVLNATVGIRKGGENMAPGADFDPAGYDNPAWRLDRAYLNAVEMNGFFVALVFAAILAGAPAFWVNLLAIAGFFCRVGMTATYVKGIGKAYGGIRTQFAIIASVVNVILGVLALIALF